MRRVSTRVALAATTAMMVAVAGRTVHSGSASASLQISIVVTNNCRVTTSGLLFSGYDPAAQNSSTPMSGSGGVTLTCTSGTTPVIGLSGGSHADGATRRASDGANYIAYQLFKDSGHTQPWGESGGDVLNAGVTASKQPRTFPVHAQVPAGQNVPSGTYTDTVVVSVNF